MASKLIGLSLKLNNAIALFISAISGYELLNFVFGEIDPDVKLMFILRFRMRHIFIIDFPFKRVK